MGSLFSTTTIHGLPLKNRIMALPVFTGYALPDSRVSPLMLEHYTRLAQSGAAIVVVPNVAVAANGRTSERSLLLDDDSHVEGLSRLASCIKKNNAVACVQLNHAGRYAITDSPLLPSAFSVAEASRSISLLKDFMETFPFTKRFGLTAHVAKMTAGWTQEMDDTDIERVITQYASAAKRAVRAGFDMVELHGSTGYLIAQFLSARTNKRPAPWGGTSRHRMRFPLRVLEAVLDTVPDGFPVGFRLLMDEMAKGGVTPSEALDLAQKLERRGIAYVSATAGSYQSVFSPSVARRLAKPGYLGTLGKHLKERIRVPVVNSGRVLSPALAEDMVSRGQGDIIGLGRPLLADPEWIAKATDKRKITKCNNCGNCFQQVALGESIYCSRWPQVMQDRVTLETRFTSRHSYRTLVVLSSVADLEVSRRIDLSGIAPIHKDIFDRLLFLNCGEPGFTEAAEDYSAWADDFSRESLQRVSRENVFLDDVEDPLGVVIEHLKDRFGLIVIVHDETSEWKKQLVLQAPSDVVVALEGTHPNFLKVFIPCDLSMVSLLQIRVAQHGISGREKDVTFHFAHVSSSPEHARNEWRKLLEKAGGDILGEFHVIPPVEGQSTARTLIDEVHRGDFGRIVLGRRGGFTRVRRKILGSVSDQMLRELPGRSFVLIG